MFGANPKIVEFEAAKIQGKYEKHEGLIEISQLYETQKVIVNNVMQNHTLITTNFSLLS